MPFLIFFLFAGMAALCYSRFPRTELRVHFEPLPNQKNSWPLARVALVNYDASRDSLECRMLSSIEDISRQGIHLPATRIKAILKQEMDALEKRCSSFAEAGRQTITYPGTKWCGDSDNAANYSDLGPLEADKCCRDHDHCDGILSGETKYNLTNEGMFTLLNCECEEALDNCFKETARNETDAFHKLLTVVLRLIYFELYSPKCYVLTCDNSTEPNCVGEWRDGYEDA
uniref:Venom toxin n=2 Tax=Hemiscorpius lepturus TaxID=520031 RepID=A0A1L4BJ45_HEMLE|nr:venom toxin [Hemiscorpius lepturus]DAZ87718.1 TPA_exp: leptulipin [Hemiscorpius lepturus]